MPIPPFEDWSPERRLALARRLAWLMDSSMTIPILGKRIGLDALLGVVPIGGDALGSLVSLYIVYLAHTLGVPRHLLSRMVGNLLIDFTVGSVPLVGDTIDALWKANIKNVAIIEAHLGISKVRQVPWVWRLAVSALGKPKKQPVMPQQQPPSRITLDVRPGAPPAGRF